MMRSTALPARAVLLAMLGLAAGAAPRAWAAPERYELDPVHTRVMFAIDHAGFSRALGAVSGGTGELLFDPRDWSTARIEVSVPLLRLDLGDAKWNQATLARNLLDGERHPHATFVSTAIEPLAEDRARVHGLLTLRGVTREIALDVRLNAVKRHPLPPFRRTAGFSATATILRSDFGIDAWKNLIGDEVELRIEAEAVRRRHGAQDDATLPADPSPAESEPKP